MRRLTVPVFPERRSSGTPHEVEGYITLAGKQTGCKIAVAGFVKHVEKYFRAENACIKFGFFAVFFYDVFNRSLVAETAINGKSICTLNVIEKISGFFIKIFFCHGS